METMETMWKPWKPCGNQVFDVFDTIPLSIPDITTSLSSPIKVPPTSCATYPNVIHTHIDTYVTYTNIDCLMADI
jgi:hypothetical protein